MQGIVLPQIMTTSWGTLDMVSSHKSFPSLTHSVVNPTVFMSRAVSDNLGHGQ